MTQILTSFYDTYDEAKRTVGDLEAAGISHSDISIIASNAEGVHTSGATTGAEVGAIAGGGAGLLAGLGLWRFRVLALSWPRVGSPQHWLAPSQERRGAGLLVPW